MSKNAVRGLLAALASGLLASSAPAQDDEALGFERTPPRLSFADGEVSFWRAGGGEWTPAHVNTALAPGDELYTGERANLELQVGARAYVRAGEQTQLGLTNLEPDFMQIRVTAGHVSLDLRSVKAGHTFELGTPNAAFTIERTGYYRVEVDGETTTFTTRRGGRASMTLAEGEPTLIASSEQVVVSGADEPEIETYAAQELDAWDRWNYARTDDQIEAVSARYVPSGVYGVDDLDQHGDWRLVPSYGAVWVPRNVAVGWVPYSTGRWLYDPYYGWTWVDDAPWGWAPYHHGRWVRVSSYWGWCPGPIVARPYYAPALVAFYGGGGFSAGFTFGRPRVGWVALGWGEPLVPWWGSSRFRSHPRWGGWGGPRVVNNVVVKHKTVIHVKEINVYQNARVHDAIVEVDRDHFGRRKHSDAHFRRAKADRLQPLHGGFDVKPDRSSFVADDRPAKRPPREARERSVVATREPRADSTPAHVVQPPREGKHKEASKRPPFGQRGEAERRIPPPAPRFEDSERAKAEPARGERQTPRAERERVEREPERAAKGRTPVEREPVRAAKDRTPVEREPVRAGPERARVEREPRAPREEQTRPERPQAARPERDEPMRAEPRELPGEPANRVYRQRQESTPRGSERAARSEERSRSREARAQTDGHGDSNDRLQEQPPARAAEGGTHSRRR